MLATLCVVLAVVFAGASAASVVDRLEHARHFAHDHELNLAFTADLSDGAAQAGPGQPDGGGDPEREPRAGHHHIDAPLGGLNGPYSSTPVVRIAEITQPSAATVTLDGLRPGGLERPPRRLATLV